MLPVLFIAACAATLSAQDADGSGPPMLGLFGSGLHNPGDLDSDGVADLLIESDGHAMWAYSACRADPLWGSGTPAGCATPRAAFANVAGLESQRIGSVEPAGDLDLDGTPDLWLVVSSVPASAIRLLAIDGARGALLASVELGPSAWSNGIPIAACGDQDGDGRSDLVVALPSWLVTRPRLEIRSGLRCDLIAKHELGDWRSGSPRTLAYVAGVDARTREASEMLWVGESHEKRSTYGLVAMERADGQVARFAVTDGARAPSIGIPELVKIRGELWDSFEAFGASLAAVGDADGDGWPEVVIGAAAYIFGAETFLGSFDGRSGRLLGVRSTEGTCNDRNLGWLLRRGPDIDGDGLGEVIAATPRGGAQGQGRVDLLALRSLETVRSWEAPDGGSAGGWGFGVSAATIGDLDADGVDDVAIGMCWAVSSHERKQVRFYSSKSGAFLGFITAADMLR